MIKPRSLFALSIVAIVWLMGAPHATHAATLQLSPSSASYHVGDTFTVAILVSSMGQAMNAASGVLNYSSDLLSVASISKSETIMSLWVQEPSYSNADGQARFEGVVLNPGYTGSNGIIMRVTFRARAAGEARLAITSGSVLANDGNGTELFSRASGATISIAPALPIPTPTSARPVPTIAVTPTPQTPTVHAIRDITTRDFFDISGTTYPNALVEMTLVDRSRHSSLQSAQADSSGAFRIAWSEHLTAGAYTFTVRAQTIAGEYSSSTPSVMFVVSPSLADRVGSFVVGNVALLVVLLVLIITLPLFVEHRRVSHNVDVVGERVHAQFKQLKESLTAEVRSLERVRTKRALTIEEERLLNRLGKLIDKSEEAVEHDLKSVS